MEKRSYVVIIEEGRSSTALEQLQTKWPEWCLGKHPVYIVPISDDGILWMVTDKPITREEAEALVQRSFDE